MFPRRVLVVRFNRICLLCLRNVNNSYNTSCSFSKTLVLRRLYIRSSFHALLNTFETSKHTPFKQNNHQQRVTIKLLVKQLHNNYVAPNLKEELSRAKFLKFLEKDITNEIQVKSFIDINPKLAPTTNFNTIQIFYPEIKPTIDLSP